MQLPEDEGNEMVSKIVETLRKLENNPDLEEVIKRIERVITLCEKISILEEGAPEEERDGLVSEIMAGIYEIQDNNIESQIEELTPVKEMMRRENAQETVVSENDPADGVNEEHSRQDS
jgi:hypothetical protein